MATGYVTYVIYMMISQKMEDLGLWQEVASSRRIF